MSTRKHVSLPLLFGALLAGVAPNPAGAAGPYDGTYRGPLTATEAMGRTCHSAAGVSRVVTDNVLSYQWAGAQMNIPVAADGSISGERRFGSAGKGRGLLRVTGRITSNVMTLDSEGNGCGFHFEGRRTR